MSGFALLDCTVLVNGYDFSGDVKKVTVDTSAEALDATTFRSGGFKANVGGLKSVSANVDGFWSSSADNEGFSDLGNANRVVTVAPTSQELATAYMFQVVKLKYSPFGNVGDVTPFSLEMSGSNSAGVVRGQVAKASGTVSALGPIGSPVNLGAVSGTQFVYATFHVLGTPGSSIQVKVESSSTAGFGTANLVQSLGTITTAGGTWMPKKAGPITDTWYRFNVTAITGTFTVAGAIAVQ